MNKKNKLSLSEDKLESREMLSGNPVNVASANFVVNNGDVQGDVTLQGESSFRARINGVEASARSLPPSREERFTGATDSRLFQGTPEERSAQFLADARASRPQGQTSFRRSISTSETIDLTPSRVGTTPQADNTRVQSQAEADFRARFERSRQLSFEERSAEIRARAEARGPSTANGGRGSRPLGKPNL